MKEINTKTEYTFDENLFFFDIETTGLSAQTSYLYQIGLLRKTNGESILTQLFCEEYSEEKAVLKRFIEILAENPSYTLIHYNGSTFDIPYLNHKFKRHKLLFEIDKERTVDIFKRLIHYKKYIDLPDFKLKTIENAADFHRNDEFNGGELIDVYAEYTGRRQLYSITKKEEHKTAVDSLEYVLLLHNKEDIMGLYEVYRKCGFLDKAQVLKNVSYEDKEDCLNFHIAMPLFPTVFRAEADGIILESNPDNSILTIPKYNGTLKMYFEDYKDYFIVLDTGEVMHSSLWSAVAKDNRRKCKKEEAYLAKNSVFLPIGKTLIDCESFKKKYIFKSDLKDKTLFIEAADAYKDIDTYFEGLWDSMF